MVFATAPNSSAPSFKSFGNSYRHYRLKLKKIESSFEQCIAKNQDCVKNDVDTSNCVAWSTAYIQVLENGFKTSNRTECKLGLMNEAIYP